MNRVVKIADDLRRRLSAANEVIEFHKARVVNRDHQIAELSKLTPEPVPASTTPRIEPGLYSECMWTP